MPDSPAARRVLVTGGGSGIGAAAAAALTEQGDDVAICGRREPALRRVAARLGCRWIVADCTDVDAVAAAVEFAAGDGPAHLDGVVHSAGSMFTGSVLQTAPADWDDCLRNNAGSAFLVARAALPQLIRSRGAMVLVSSVAALRSSSGSAAYAAAKAATVSLGQAIAVEHGPAGVRTNVVCPGWVRTELADAEMVALHAPGIDAAYAEITGLVPQRRAAEPAEVGAAIAWLCGPQASYVNGAVLTVDGGVSVVDAGTVPFDFTLAPRT